MPVVTRLPPPSRTTVSVFPEEAFRRCTRPAVFSRSVPGDNKKNARAVRAFFLLCLTERAERQPACVSSTRAPGGYLSTAKMLRNKSSPSVFFTSMMT